MNKKIKIIEMIEQGFSNQDIAEATGAKYNYVSTVRCEYNEVATRPIYSLQTKPKLGTKLRRAYDIVVANPDATVSEVSRVVGLSASVFSKLEKRYGIRPPRERAPRVSKQ